MTPRDHMNATCDNEEALSGAAALFEDHLIGSLAFHQLALILSATFVCLACAFSYWLILDHARHYPKPNEQKQCVCYTSSKCGS